MAPYFQQYPLGHSINDSPHSVCVSLPTMADVVGYEEKDPQVIEHFAAGYPRFFRNPLLGELARECTRRFPMDQRDPLFSSEAAAQDLCSFLGLDVNLIYSPLENLWTVRIPEDSAELRQESLNFLQHTGSGLASREAESLLDQHFQRPPFPENRRKDSPEGNRAFIRAKLHDVYGTASEQDIHLFRSGMNAFYSGFRALQSVQGDRGRDLWIQLGWLYVDTSRILTRFALPGAAPIRILKVLDLTELKECLASVGHRVAGIVTETPTNPLVQTADLEALRALADKYKVGLILDPTMVSPQNVNILAFSDIHINSLTKYAAPEADVMMGALALNNHSRFYDDLLPLVSAFGIAPSPADLARMAAQIGNYAETIGHINASTREVAAFLESHPAIDSVFWAETQPSAYNYNWLKHRQAGPGGIITFTTKGPMASFYDACAFVKSPSFGARFTMICPFMYLAHYDLVRSPAGRAFLQAQGLSPDLLRLSIGLEPAEAIIAQLQQTL